MDAFSLLDDNFLLIGMQAPVIFLGLAEEHRRMLQEQEERHREEEERRNTERRPRKRRKRFWVRQLYLERQEHGHYEQMMAMMELHDVESYKNFQRVSPEEFRAVLARVGPRLTKQDTTFRKALPAGLKLAVTLRYLASGDLYRTLAFGFRLSVPSITNVIPEVCDAIVDEYMPEFLACPQTPAEWKAIAEGFYNKWNMPHCIGAIDGKHVALQCPQSCGSLYYNYKGFHSIVLMAIVDADYNFIYVDVGCNGSGSDGGVFKACSFRKAIENGDLGIPEEDALPDSDQIVPYFLVGDEAFPLKTWLMKPIPRRGLSKEQRIYNYRLSRARRVVENAFGILSAKYRCLHTTMLQSPERVQKIVLACCCLHNLIRRSMPQIAVQAADLPSSSGNQQLPELQNHNTRNQGTNAAKQVRNTLLRYVNSPEGSVAWQDEKI